MTEPASGGFIDQRYEIAAGCKTYCFWPEVKPVQITVNVHVSSEQDIERVAKQCADQIARSLVQNRAPDPGAAA